MNELQILLEVEANQNLSDRPDSLMDRVLVGMIASHRKLQSFLYQTRFTPLC
jgi:hypothetical protein